jgi:hypothetical protein
MLICCLLAGVAMGQENPNPEQLKRMYDEALEQLRTSQDRKNELASENEQLRARIAELQRQNTEMRRQADRFHERTLFLRGHYAAWQVFLRTRPTVSTQWQQFLETDPTALPDTSIELFDPAWPIRESGVFEVVPDPRPTTAPSTQPADETPAPAEPASDAPATQPPASEQPAPVTPAPQPETAPANPS